MTIQEDISIEQVALAEAIAREAHTGQFRKAGDDKGKPYIVHPERLAAKADTNLHKAAAFLHDVVEDTDFTFDTLATRGVDNQVIEVLKFLTKKKGENYLDFIARILTCWHAMHVKLLDLEDNMMSLDEGSLKDKYRLAKYIILERIESYKGRKFYLNGKDAERYYAWKEEHDKLCPFTKFQGAIGGRFSYTFCPTSLGTVVAVKCACGEEVELTDVGEW